MLERLDKILNAVIGSFIGVFISHSIYRYFHYINHPEIYEIQSAPWYTSILIYGLADALIVFVAIIIKFLVKKKMRSV